MATFDEFYVSLDPNVGIRGKQFEKFVKWFLKTDPKWASQIVEIWLWNEYPKMWSGDLLILDKLRRLGRTMVTMLVEINKLLDKGVKIRRLDRRLEITTMNKEIINLIVIVLGYSAEMELTNNRRRPAEGRTVRKSEGVKFEMNRKYDQHKIAEIMRKIEKGEGYGTIGRALGTSRARVVSIVKERR